MSGLGKLGGFGSSTVMNGLVGLITIPFIIAFAGNAAWGGMAVAQSIASMFVVLIAFGWGVMGPSRVASSPFSSRGQQYSDAIVLRVLLLLAVLPFAFYLIAAYAPGNKAADILAGFALMVAGLGGSWFFIGEGKAWKLFFIDTVPRCVGTISGTLVLGLTGEVTYFAAAQLAGSIISVSFAASDILRRHRDHDWRLSISPQRQLKSFKEQIPGVLTAAASSMYMNAPLTVLAGLAPASVPVYAMADKLTRFAVMAASPMTQLAQSSVPNPDDSVLSRNIRLTTKLSAVGALIAGIALSLAMPTGAKILAAGEIEVSLAISTAFGLTLAAIMFSQISGLVSLMAIGRAKTVAASVIIGLLVAIPAVSFGASQWGAAGAAWGLASSETAVAVFQFAALRKALRTRARKASVEENDQLGANT
jgi:O-antigen/teichoic acid export membrane protein